jgi:hypothetical protein
MSKTRLYIYLFISILSLLYRLYEKDGTGVVLSLMVIATVNFFLIVQKSGDA